MNDDDNIFYDSYSFIARKIVFIILFLIVLLLIIVSNYFEVKAVRLFHSSLYDDDVPENIDQLLSEANEKELQYKRYELFSILITIPIFIEYLMFLKRNGQLDSIKDELKNLEGNRNRQRYNYYKYYYPYYNSGKIPPIHNNFQKVLLYSIISAPVFAVAVTSTIYIGDKFCIAVGYGFFILSFFLFAQLKRNLSNESIIFSLFTMIIFFWVSLNLFQWLSYATA